MNEMKVKLPLRKYQEELLKDCLKENRIVYLPTGSGKTFIAVMLIKEIMNDCFVKFGARKKLAVFAVNHIALAQQQADYIRRHIDLSVGMYIGIMEVDYWDAEKWNREFNKNQVLVMTVQILNNIIIHKFVDVNQIALVVFDECHAATGNHPMKQAAENIIKLHDNPRILGLSGSLINGDCKINSIVNTLCALETTFNSKIASARSSLLSEVQRYSTKPEEEILYYASPVKNAFLHNVYMSLEECQKFVMQKNLNDNTSVALKAPRGSIPLNDILKKNKDLKSVLDNVKYQLQDLGVYGGYVSTHKYSNFLEKSIKKYHNYGITVVLEKMKQTVDEVKELLESKLKETTDPRIKVKNFSTDKLVKLQLFLEEIFAKPLNKMEGEMKTRIIIFVKRRSTAMVLSCILEELSNFDPKLKIMKSQYVMGYSANQSTPITESLKRQNEAAIEGFRVGKLNVLVATDVLEEGIDIPKCNIVIMFDPPSSCRSYIQSKGRARHETSRYCIFVAQEDVAFHNKLDVYRAVGHKISEVLNERGIIVDRITEENAVDDTIAWNLPVGSQARVTGSHAIQLVHKYCNKLPHDRFSVLTPLWYLNRTEEGLVCSVQFPMNSRIKYAIKGKPQPGKRLAKQSAAIEALKHLIRNRELDENLIPTYHENIIYEHSLFPHLKQDDVGDDDPLHGTKKQKRLFIKGCPLVLTNCKPKENCYLYSLIFQIRNEQHIEDTEDEEFYRLYNEDETYGILSSQEMPQMRHFPLFIRKFQLDVRIVRSNVTYNLNSEDVKLCESFHRAVFDSILNLVKPFMSVDHEERNHSYLIVPVKKSETVSYEINWDTMHNSVTYDGNILVSDVKSYKKLHRCILTPRNSLQQKQFYIVTADILDDSHINHPHVEVRKVPTTSNFLKPQTKKLSTNSYGKKQIVPSDLYDVVLFPGALVIKAHLLPSVLHQLSVFFLGHELQKNVPIINELSTQSLYQFSPGVPDIPFISKTVSGSAPSSKDVIQALTTSSADDIFNSETLETLGDTFLKFVVSLFLLIRYPQYHEGTLSIFKAKIISNSHFCRVGFVNDIGSKLQIHSFSPKDNWLPPGFCVPKEICRDFLENQISPTFLNDIHLTKEEKLTGKLKAQTKEVLKGKELSWKLRNMCPEEMFIGVQTVTDKAMADAIEALTGVYLKAYGMYGAVQFLNKCEVLPKKEASPHVLFDEAPGKSIMNSNSDPKAVKHHLGDASCFEHSIGYTFKDKGFLLQALTHPSYAENRETDCYQRLEFLGDAILDFLVTSYFYSTIQKPSPGTLTRLRAILVNNNTFAVLAVRCGLHKYVRYTSSELFYNIDSFVRYQTENDFEITDELVYVDDNKVVKEIIAPKVLGDLFESVAAAIFLDSGKSLEKVWNIYYKLMEKELLKISTTDFS